MSNRFGLNEERYNQMMAACNNNEGYIEDMVEDWGVDYCNRGYAVFNFNLTGMLSIKSIFDYTDEEAVQKAKADGYSFIPMEELPEIMPECLRYFGYIDTKENREIIQDCCQYIRDNNVPGYN